MCLYEYPILLKRLYEVGANGKLWKLLKDWYEGLRGRDRESEVGWKASAVEGVHS